MKMAVTLAIKHAVVRLQLSATQVQPISQKYHLLSGTTQLKGQEPPTTTTHRNPTDWHIPQDSVISLWV